MATRADPAKSKRQKSSKGDLAKGSVHVQDDCGDLPRFDQCTQAPEDIHRILQATLPPLS